MACSRSDSDRTACAFGTTPAAVCLPHSMWSIYGRSRHTIPNNRATTQVPSAQPIPIKNPHTSQTNNALAEITGTIRHPPFDLAELFGSGSCAV